MADTFFVHAAAANLRATPGTRQAPLARLPAGHPVTPTGARRGDWQPCRTEIGDVLLDGFVHHGLLREPVSREVDALVRVAGEEYARFAFGALHETHPLAQERIRDYWLSFAPQAQPVSEPWSAAFISFVVGSAALPLTFAFSGRHTTYLSDGKRARVAGDASRAYWTLRLDEAPLRVGDLVGAYRTGGRCGSAVRTYDSLPGDFCSHCDLVVAVQGDKAVTLGGNLSNTVKATEVPLTADGCAASGAKRIAVMSRRF